MQHNSGPTQRGWSRMGLSGLSQSTQDKIRRKKVGEIGVRIQFKPWFGGHRKGNTKKLRDKDLAERSGELSGAICLKTLVLLGNDQGELNGGVSPFVPKCPVLSPSVLFCPDFSSFQAPGRTKEDKQGQNGHFGQMGKRQDLALLESGTEKKKGVLAKGVSAVSRVTPKESSIQSHTEGNT